MIENDFKNFKLICQIEIERAYRKGFDHGFHAGKYNKTNSEKIREWRYDLDESLITGAPGTSYEGRLFCNLEQSFSDSDEKEFSHFSP